jgi:hypothetical protein
MIYGEHVERFACRYAGERFRGLRMKTDSLDGV